MKSPARLGESAPRTSTPSTGVETRSAGEEAPCCTLMVATLGEGADGRAAPPPRVRARAARAGRLASRRARRPACAAQPTPRDLQARHDRGQRRPGLLLVVPRRRADRGRHGPARRADLAGARTAEVRRG